MHQQNMGNKENSDKETHESNEKKFTALTAQPSPQEEKKTGTLFLYFAAIAANLIVIADGIIMSWTSPVIPQLKSLNKDMNPLGYSIRPVEESVIAALAFIGPAFGPLVSWKFVDKYGRRKVFIFLGVLMLTSNVALAFADTIILFYTSRALLGLGAGVSLAIVPMYIGEISEDHNRGRLGYIMGTFIAVGMLFSLAAGPFLSVKIFTLSSAVPLIIFIGCFMFFIPESPLYLLSVGDREGAIRALQKLRNNPNRIETDLAEIAKVIEESSKSAKGQFRDIFKSVVLRKGLVICVGLNVLQQFIGLVVIFAFLGPILDATGTGLPTDLSSAVMGLLQVVTAVFTFPFVDILGRKTLLLISAIGSGISLTVLGLYFFFKDANGLPVDHIFWVPVTFLILYNIFGNIGLANIPFTIMGEVFPSNVKSMATSLAVSVGYLIGFFVVLVFPVAVEYIGMAVCFLTMGLSGIIGSIFICNAIPETKGKSLLEIQKVLTV